MNVESWAQLAVCLSSLATVVLVFYAARSVKIAKRVASQAADSIRVAVAEQTSPPFSLITQEYLDRRFRSTIPPTINDRMYWEVRQLKKYAWDEYAHFKTGEALERWKQDSSLQSSGWQNRLAFEISIALERIGIAVFTNVIPARFFLALAADQVLEDWPIAKFWIDSYRSANAELRHKDYGVPFHRRHAEWLVLLSALWMDRMYPAYPPLATVKQLYGNADNVKDEFKRHCRADLSLLSEHQQAELAELVDMDVKELFGE